MTPAKRIMDISLGLLLALILLPVIALLSLLILIFDGRPVFYLAERMKTTGTPFCLWKFRTMTVTDRDSGVSAGYKSSRITRMGAFLRRNRLDELPQLLNILRGDMSFVGPRPPLRRYVEMFPGLYGGILTHRPRGTGHATLVFHHTEERLLAGCQTAAETEDVYIRRCIPVKARLDLIWAENRNLCFDLKLIIETAIRVFSPKRRR